MRINSVVRDYRIVSKLGAGGMGEVWLGEHLHLKTKVAIKILAPYLRENAAFGERLLREAQSQVSLQHPQIVQVRDFFEESQHYFMVTEYVPGYNLQELLEAKGRIPIPQALKVTRDVLTALHHAHSNGVIHRDIKPANIMVDGQGRAKIMDFGLATVAGMARHGTDHMVIGSPHYMSPEQIQDPQCVDHRMDVYAMGVVLYEMLTGSPPFNGETARDIWDGHMSMTPKSPRRIQPKISQSLNQVISKALAKSADERFSGCGEFGEFISYCIDELEEASSTETSQQSQPDAAAYPSFSQPQPQTRKNPQATVTKKKRRNTLINVEASPQKSATRTSSSGNDWAPFIGDMNALLFFLIATTLGLFITHVLGFMSSALNAPPLSPSSLQALFFGGDPTASQVSAGVGLFSVITSLLWAGRAMARGKLSDQAVIKGLVTSLALAAVHTYILFLMAVPFFLYMLTSLDVLEVFRNAASELEGPGLTQAICYGLWYAQLGLGSLLCPLVGRVMEES